MHDDAQQQPLRVHRDVALASCDLLGRIVAARAAGLRRLHALAVDDRSRGACLTADAFAQQDHKVVAHALPYARAEERAEVAVHRRPGQERRRRWQVPPLAAGTQQVEQAVQQVPHVRRPRATAGLGRRDQRLHQPSLVVRQPLARPVIANQRTVFRRPHRRPHDSQTVWNAASTPPVRPSRRRKRPSQTGSKSSARCPAGVVALSSSIVQGVDALWVGGGTGLRYGTSK